MNFIKTAICILSLSFTISCKTTNKESAVLSVSSQSTIEKLWVGQEMLANSDKIQLNCRPKIVEPNGPAKGAIMLFHGFTACPQQFYSIAEEFSKYGYRVYIPLLPGHGIEKSSEKEYRALPTLNNAEKTFDAFIAQMEQIMITETSSEKIIGGLSLGGMLATRAITRESHPYQRALIMTPFFKINDKLSNVIGGVKNVHIVTNFLNTPFKYLSYPIVNKESSWGEGCIHEREMGRAGYCEFTLGNVAAMQQYGQKTMALPVRKNVSIQLIGVEKDAAVSNSAIAKFLSLNQTVESCNFRFPANHSLVSRFDSPSENKFWMTTLEDSMLNFVMFGENFKTTQQKLDGLSECLIYY